MTTREYLTARAIRFHSFGSPLVLVLLGVTIWGRQSALIESVALVVLASYLVFYIVFMRRTPCLRCAVPLHNPALGWGSHQRPAPRCPHCGVSIDEQLGEPHPLPKNTG